MTRTNFMKCAIECSIFKINLRRHGRYFALIYMQNGSNSPIRGAFLFCHMHKFISAFINFIPFGSVCVSVCYKKDNPIFCSFYVLICQKKYSYLRTSVLPVSNFLIFLNSFLFNASRTQNHDYDNHKVLTATKENGREREREETKMIITCEPRTIIIINHRK